MLTRVWRTRPRRVATAVAFAIAAQAAPSVVHAQAGAPSGLVTRVGETVRVRTAAWIYTGTLRRVAPDSAFVTFGHDSVAIPRSSIVRLETQRGTRRSLPRILVGTALGAATGMLIGGLTGVALECGRSCADDGEMAGFAGSIGGGVIGGAVGAITGGVIGGRKRYPRWVPAILPAPAP